jgi:hypothetical protein
MREAARHPLSRACRLPVAVTLPVLLFSMCLSVAAAPSEGTAGQTVTGRTLHHNGLRTAPAAPQPAHARPEWKDLTPAQQQALQPLAPHWSWLSEERKLKWLAISRNFQSLSPEEQAKVHRRMSKWVTLTQQQRAQARQNFKEIKNFTPEQKASQWEAYQALSAEEKRKLASQARVKPAGLTMVKPATTPKLSQVPRRAPSGSRLAEVVSPLHAAPPRPEPVRSEPERSPYEDEPAESR